MVVLGQIWGVIRSYLSELIVECALGINSAVVPNSTTLMFYSGQWSMIELDFDADINLMPDPFKVAKVRSLNIIRIVANIPIRNHMDL